MARSLVRRGRDAGARGYQNHPQLQRFKQQTAPVASIASYLQGVHAESLQRGYRFDASKIKPLPDVTANPAAAIASIATATGQIAYEWQHLLAKLQARSPEVHQQWQSTKEAGLHPLFHSMPGPVADWEKL